MHYNSPTACGLGDAARGIERFDGTSWHRRSNAPLHFIGVGGVGMSGIARVAADQGLVVTGSDLKESRYTK